MKKANYHLTFSNTADQFLEKADVQLRSRLIKIANPLYQSKIY